MKSYSLQAYDYQKVHEQLDLLTQQMVAAEKTYHRHVKEAHPNFQISAVNLLHYLVLRSTEIREVQDFLHKVGLSSLANCESHTMAQVQNVVRWLNPNQVGRPEVPCSFEEAGMLRNRHSEELLGMRPSSARPHIMVTFNEQMAHDRLMVEEMLHAGMSVARINCAHDTPEVWEQMIDGLNRSISKTGRNCKVYMDLAGPKIRVAALPAQIEREQGLPLREDQELLLLPVDQSEQIYDTTPIWVEPSLILSMVKPGEHIFFDDGKFEAKVMEVNGQSARVRIKRISTKKPFLKAEKGINLPDTDLKIPPLTPEDISNIPFICQHADMVGFSFVSEPADVDTLRTELRKHATRKTPAIILKIERLSAIQNLPALLMKGMQDESFGVMIARGDLAVEIGFERLSEIQEEILWISEAAHVPVIWATQVLETMNKTGFATRSEITDAAFGGMAECVMLNKGKYVTKTIATLDDILNRQVAHVDKKRYILRPLGIARNFLKW
ncbi:MAG: pyruvate kinase [Bacteroidetes bacterium]|nr:pyruvate kinase [Bacteroidota bacterium]